jgi:hypothetical protein
MAIQQLPLNGQTKIINGVSYVYTAANNSWTVGTTVPPSTDIVYSDSLYISSNNGITFSDGTKQTTATALDVWLRGYANASFSKANSANILAQAAYTQANTGTTLAQAAFNVANNVSGGTAQDGFARIVANTASANTIYTQGVDTTQNTRITIIEGINTTQNTNITIIQGVDNTQNTNITIANNAAQAAFAQANNSATTGKAIAMAMVFGG